MKPVEIPAGRRLSGEVSVPPSKSLTNRALNLALLARAPMVLERPLLSDDTRALLAALEQLGIEGTSVADGVLLNPGELPAGATIDCGASGTMARFMTGALTVLRGSWLLDGSARLRERPVGPLIECLRGLGAHIECAGRDGFLPLAIEGGLLRGGAATIDAGDSSQYLSALLMASTRAQGPVEVTVSGLTSAPYVELTLELMGRFGAGVERSGRAALRVTPGLSAPGSYTVEGDMSAACYFAAAAALTAGRVQLTGLSAESKQGDLRFLSLLERMGAGVEWSSPDRVSIVGGERLEAIDVDMSELPDQVPTLAAIAPFAAGTTRIRNVAHLRIKESDRLSACAGELGRLGAVADEWPDGLSIEGIWARDVPPANPVLISTHDDHRIAMSFALSGLKRPGVSIADPGVTSKSYPAFWKDLERCLAA